MLKGEELAKLIADVEGAERGTRGLECRVALALGWLRRTPTEAGNRHGDWIAPEDHENGQIKWDSLHGTSTWRDPPRFCRDLQCAESAVPKGCAVVLWCLPKATWPGRAWLYRDGTIPSPEYEGKVSLGKTLPLALVTAILRAKDGGSSTGETP